MTRRELIDWCLTLPGAYEDYPFDTVADGSCWAALRHRGNRRCFAFVYARDDVLFVNLKCEPMQGEFWRQVYASWVTPGYHMNKTHWVSAAIGPDTDYDALRQMLRESHALTAPRKKS